MGVRYGVGEKVQGKGKGGGIHLKAHWRFVDIDGGGGDPCQRDMI